MVDNPLRPSPVPGFAWYDAVMTTPDLCLSCRAPWCAGETVLTAIETDHCSPFLCGRCAPVYVAAYTALAESGGGGGGHVRHGGVMTSGTERALRRWNENRDGPTTGCFICRASKVARYLPQRPRDGKSDPCRFAFPLCESCGAEYVKTRALFRRIP